MTLTAPPAAPCPAPPVGSAPAAGPTAGPTPDEPVRLYGPTPAGRRELLATVVVLAVLLSLLVAALVPGPPVGFTRPVALVGIDRTTPATPGGYRAVLVGERSWLHQALAEWGALPISMPVGWRAQPGDPRDAGRDTAFAAEDAWVASRAVLGRPVTTTPYAEVVFVAPHSAFARAGIVAGDVIRAVDGLAMAGQMIVDVTTAGRHPVTLTVERAGVVRTVVLPATRHRFRAGLYTAEHAAATGAKLSARIPEHETGPSGGLVHALAMVDAETPGSLTAGRTVVATGVVTPDGRVLPVGRVPVKVAGALRAGADVMLVPASELTAARRAAAGRLHVVGVASLAGAVVSLCETGGTGPACRAGRTRLAEAAAARAAGDHLDALIAALGAGGLASQLAELTGTPAPSDGPGAR